MPNWLRKLFKSPARPDSDDEIERHLKLWGERVAGLEKLLGPSEDMHLHAVMPLHLGGGADVLEFRQHVPGHCYVTSDLTGDPTQLPNSLGNYELMICTREKSDWAPNLISKLANYTFQAVLEPGQTMDIGPALPNGSAASALLFAVPDLDSNEFFVQGSKCGLLLCITILPEELEACFKQNSSNVLEALRIKGVFPFSDLNRNPIIQTRQDVT